MASSIDAAANRITPWRTQDWRVAFVEGALLVAAGIYLLADQERAQFILGLVVGAGLLIDGGRQWHLGLRRLARGRIRDVALIRGAIGIITGVLVLALSILQQITCGRDPNRDRGRLAPLWPAPARPRAPRHPGAPGQLELRRL